MIGSVMFLVTCTRPDLAFSVSYLTCLSSQPLAHHDTAVKSVLRYLAGTPFMSLNYKRSPTSFPLSIVAFSDPNYASCRDAHRSLSGYPVMSNYCTISWLSQAQQSVASSTTEAEYMALATTFRQAVWYQNAFSQLSYSIHITLMPDNTSRMNVAANPFNNSQTKYIDVGYHFTSEHLRCKSLTLAYVASDDYTADLMTKV